MEFVLFEPEQTIFNEDPVSDVVGDLAKLVQPQSDSITEIALELGGAVSQSYRRFAQFVGLSEIAARFEHGIGPELTVLMLSPEIASHHAEILSRPDTLEVKTIEITGILDTLSESTSRFRLRKSPDMADSDIEVWRDHVGSVSKIEGELTEAAIDDIQRMNAWSKLVKAQIRLTKMSSPTTNRKADIEAQLLGLIHAQEQL
jgi:hypothetical protein